MFTTSTNIWLCRCSVRVLHECSNPSVMVHERDVSMSEVKVCSSARKYFFLHSRGFIQSYTGKDFVSVQGNALREIILKTIYWNSSGVFTVITKEEINRFQRETKDSWLRPSLQVTSKHLGVKSQESKFRGCVQIISQWHENFGQRLTSWLHRGMNFMVAPWYELHGCTVVLTSWLHRASLIS